MATDTSKDSKVSDKTDDTSVHNEKLSTEDVKTDSDAAKPFELHTGDRLEGTPPDRFRAVRGVNPNTGANTGLVQRVADDEMEAELALVLRRMAVGSFQALNGDLRTVEASCKAAETFTAMFGAHGIGFRKLSKKETEELREDAGLTDAADRSAEAEANDPDPDQLRAEDVKTKPNADVHRQTDNVKAESGPDDKSAKAAQRAKDHNPEALMGDKDK